MVDLSKINKNCIFICPNEKKDELVSMFNSNIEYSVKYISKGTLISSLTFSYGKDALIYLIRKGYSYDNAKEILDNLNFVKNGTDKLDLLVSLKEELTKENLLKKNSLFVHIFNNKKVYIYGYSSLDKQLTSLLDNFNINYEFILEESKQYVHKVYEYETIEEEVSNFFDQVCKMVEEGIEVSNICLYSYPSEYDLILRKYAKKYSLPINFTSNIYLNESPIFKEYLVLAEEMSLEEGFEKIKGIEDDFNTVSKILNLVNDVLGLNISKEDKISLIISGAKEIKLKENKYLKGIDIVNSSYRGDKHIFVLGFSLGSYPLIKKDTDFLSDKEKEICNINTSNVENSINYEQLENFLLNTPNVYISLKNRIGKNVYYDSLLIEKLNYVKEKGKKDNIRYSQKLVELEVSSYQDLLNDYGIDNEYLNGINPKSFRYKEYNHKFTKSKLFNNNKEMKISYSQIDEYNKCPFQYFIKRICNANAFEKTFQMKLGSLYHKVLEDSLRKGVSKADYLDEINKEFTTPKEQFFVHKLFDQILNVISKNERFKEVSSFKNDYGEQDMFYYIDTKTILRGIIDKIIVNEKDKEIIIIDYKTGNTEFKKDHIQVGQSLQLPIYSLLVGRNYPEYSQLGIYIQNVLDKTEDIDKAYKLIGVSIGENEQLNHLEHALDKSSKYIAGLTKTSTGYKKTTKIITKEEFDQVIKESEDKIKETISKIRNGEFDISPLYINGVDQVCKNCPLKTICFKDDNDNRYVELEKEEE